MLFTKLRTVDSGERSMSQCLRCGESLSEQARFCPRCGAAVSQVGADEINGSASLASNQGVEPQVMQVAAVSRDTSGEALPIPENIAGVVAYITILPAIVFLFLEPFKRNFFVRFHAFQHLFLWVAGFVIAVVAGILSALLQLIPFMRVLVFPLGGLITLAWFFVWVLLVVKAYQHELFKLPIIGDLAEQQANA
jgi:uncharacterized membrane protein